MVKFLKVILIIFISVFVIASIAIYAFLRTFDVAKYKPQIVRELAAALHRDVQLDDLSLNFSLDRGVNLAVDGLRIADDPQFSSENALTIKELRFGLAVEPLLVRRQIHISNIELGSPKIAIIRTKEGLINFSTIGKQYEKVVAAHAEALGAPSAPVDATEKQPSEQTSGAAAQLLAGFVVDSMKLKNGVVIYRDESFDPPMSVELNRVEFSLSDLSAMTASRFSLQAALFTALARNIQLEGSVTLDAQKQTVRIHDVDASVDVSGISAQQITDAFPMLAGAGLQGKIEGVLEAAISDLVVSARGLQQLSAKGKFKDGKMQLQYLGLPLTPITAAFTMTHEDVEITSSSFGLGEEGAITITGSLRDLLGQQRFSCDMNLAKIDLGKTIAQKNQPTQFHGMLNGAFELTGAGLGSAAIASAAGAGSLNVTEGKLTNINVLKVVLDKMSMIPDLVDKVEKNLPEKYKKKLQDKDTPIERVEIDATVKNGSLVVTDAQVTSDTFLLTGKGTIGFDQTVALDTSLAIPEDLSTSMVTSADNLKFLLDRKGQIMIPVKVSGKVSSPRFFPDLEYLGKRIIATRGREELNKFLDKVLDKDAEGGQAAPAQDAQGQPAQQPAQPQQEEESSEKELIDNILDSIFN